MPELRHADGLPTARRGATRAWASGEMAQRIREHDWSATSIGPIEGWPSSLLTALEICLGSRHQLALYWGPDLVLLYNDAEIEALGRLHPEALGRPARDVLGEFWDVVGPMFQRVLERGEGTWSEDQPLTFHPHGEPEERYFTWSYSPVPDDLGNVGGVLLVTTETTERVLQARRLGLLHELATRMLEPEDAAMASLVACSTLGRSRPDVQFAAIYAAEEDGACRLTGTANIDAAIGVPDRDGVRADGVWPLGRVVAARETLVLEGMPDGAGISWSSPGPRRALAVPFMRLGRDAAAGIVVVGLDPSRPLDAAYRDFLGLVAAEIGAALGDAGAREAEKLRVVELEDLARAKNEFFGNVSHELRTPLTLILGSLSDAADAATDTPTRELIEVASRNARRLAELVNSLVDMTQLDEGGASPSFAATDLARLTGDISSSFRSIAEHAGLELRVACPPLDSVVHVDRSAWEKIVINLLSNAVKYTLEGAIAVTLRRDGEAAELVVADTGIGIAAHELPLLFERFHRVRGAAGRSQEGAGIGLALVHELVGLHRGTVSVESEPGLGTAVKVRIPLGSGHLPPNQLSDGGQQAATDHLEGHVEEVMWWLPRPPIALPDEPSSSALPSDAPHVLVADDNADLRGYLARLLGSRWRVTTTADAASALAHARAAVPDLVITDLMLGTPDGLALLRSLRADPRTRDVPVIVLSALADEATVVEVLEAGADDYVVKPFTGRELIARIGASIEVARLHRDAARHRAEIDAAQAGLDRLTGLQGVTASFAGAATSYEIAQVIAKQGALALGARASTVALETADGRLEIVASHLPGSLPDPDQFEERARAALEHAFRTGRSSLYGDGAEGSAAIVAAPLRAGTCMRGAFAFRFAGSHAVTLEERRFADLLAQQCGLALERAERTHGHASELERILGELRAAQARTLAAADGERRRIERDIHDGAQQQIVAVRVKLGLAQAALTSGDVQRAASARSMVLESGRELEAALHDLRRLAHGVFPRILADEGLAHALAAASRRAAIPASVEATGVGRLPAEIESAVYFCCLEALQNAAKHAGPDASVHTRLSFGDAGSLEIEIVDDGVGFDAGVHASGAGLTNMRDRIGARGGTLIVESAVARGTAIRASIPLAVPVARATSEIRDGAG